MSNNPDLTTDDRSPPPPFAGEGLPVHVAELARACGFVVHGWGDGFRGSGRIAKNEDDASVLVEGQDVNYMGTHVEAIAFMTAWQQCISIKLAQAMLDDSDQTRIRRTLLVVDTSVPLEPGQSAQIVVRSRARMFRGERIAIPLEIAERFSIDEIRVGNDTTMEAARSIPAIAFAVQIRDATALFRFPRNGDHLQLELERAAADEFGRPWFMPAARMAQDIVFIVSNTSQVESIFCALVLGKSAW